MQTFEVKFILPFETREVSVKSVKMIDALITSLGHIGSIQQVSSDGAIAQSTPECDIVEITCVDTGKTSIVVNAYLHKNALYYDYSYDVCRIK